MRRRTKCRRGTGLLKKIVGAQTGLRSRTPTRCDDAGGQPGQELVDRCLGKGWVDVLWWNGDLGFDGLESGGR